MAKKGWFKPAKEEGESGAKQDKPALNPENKKGPSASTMRKKMYGAKE